MSKVDWTQVAVFGIVALVVFLIGASLLGTYGYRGRVPGWGMMWPGMMGYGSFGWLGMVFMTLSPLGFLILIVLSIIWLVRAVTKPSGQTPVTPGETCPNCGRAVQADWQLCPYCKRELR
jgi:uncharacterized membrane protein